MQNTHFRRGSEGGAKYSNMEIHACMYTCTRAPTHLTTEVPLRFNSHEFSGCNVQMHANVLEGRSGGWLGGPADLHQVLESPGAGGGDGEVEGSTPDTVDDSRLIKVLHRRQQ